MITHISGKQQRVLKSMLGYMLNLVNGDCVKTLSIIQREKNCRIALFYPLQGTGAAGLATDATRRPLARKGCLAYA